jgi:hypothetical protein
MDTILFWWPAGVSLSGILISICSWQKVRSKQFYSDTWWLWPWGVYVWGDGLVLGPFWFLVGLIFLNISGLLQAQVIALFFALRSGYEVVYWLNHQVASRSYIPPMVRKWTHLGPNEAAIVYQLFHTAIVCLALSMLLMLRS